MSRRSHLVLIVDDEPAISRLLSLFLERSGYRAVVATSAERGIELAISERPSLIVCDERMPGGNGEELLRSVKEHPLTSHIPVVMIGGSDTYGLMDWESKGAEAFIPKPFQINEVLAVIKKILSNNSHTPAR
jgi:two-component system, OmpR family, alkaline phosphatase synthesis response regulator PhoP